jgi:CheY-like chemotaxis protein
MWVDSLVGSGTTFLFTLPFLKPTVLSAERNDNYPYAGSYNWHGKTILVAEDDYNSFRFLRELLVKTQAEVLHAPNGKKAVEAFRSANLIDLVIMDIQMPEMDGLTATLLIKKMNPHVPVIAQTAFAMAGDKEKMQQAGCDEYITKPVNSNHLLAMINHFFSTAGKMVKSVSSTLHNHPKQ